MREIHTQWSDAHHAAATFAIVGGPRHPAVAGLQRGEAGGSRSTPAEEFFLLEQPAGFLISGRDQAGIFLSHQPAGIRSGSGAKEVRLLALQYRREMCREHGLGREERHLGIIGDSAQFSVGRGVIADALFAVSADNFVQIQKFNGSAKRIADGSAEQASPEAATQLRVGWNPGKGHFSRSRGSGCVFRRTGYANWAKFSQPYQEFPAS